MNAIPDPEEMQAGALVPAGAEIERICAERDEALQLMRQAGEAVIAARERVLEAQAVGNGAARGKRFYGHGDARALKQLFPEKIDDLDASVEAYRKDLDASIWSGLVERTGLRQMMDRTEAEKFERSLQEDVPEVTADNLRATFERLCGDAGLIFARGLARVFSELDERFKSHDAFKFEHRIILPYLIDHDGWMSTYGDTARRLYDVERVFAMLDGWTPNGGALIAQIEKDRGRGFGRRQSLTETRHFRVRTYMNGNCHMWFTDKALVEKVNKVLADYYGEVLPDAVDPDEREEPRDLFRTGRQVSKDLQFYPTPPEAAKALLEDVHIGDGMRILEPSAGEGNIVVAIFDKLAEQWKERHGHWSRWGQDKPEPRMVRPHVTAVEVHPDRCDRIRTRAKCTVVEANFLEYPALGDFDLVLMNPPFYGTHWMKHVRHAFDHLKAGGRLRAILPVTARLGESKEHLAFRRWAENHRHRYNRQWRDLPAESFASSGTRINTTILELWK